MADGDEGRGLYPKYQVRRLHPPKDVCPWSPSGVHEPAPGLYGNSHECHYCRGVYQRPQYSDVTDPVFVLKYASDPHARAALAAYADSCEKDYPILAADLRKQLGATA